jgi:hypothetical protein
MYEAFWFIWDLVPFHFLAFRSLAEFSWKWPTFDQKCSEITNFANDFHRLLLFLSVSFDQNLSTNGIVYFYYQVFSQKSLFDKLLNVA